MATKVTLRIGAAEVAGRTAAIASLRHGTELEGGHSSEAARALQDAYAAGEFSAAELVEQTKVLHGIA